jgi:hypothetical protein
LWENKNWRLWVMKEIGKSLLLLVLLTSTFFLGVWVGKENQKRKVPYFQEEDISF